MQFIDFKKEHFSHDEATGHYFLEIPKDEVDYENVKIQQRNGDQLSDEIDYDLIDHPTRIRVILKDAQDIRVNF